MATMDTSTYSVSSIQSRGNDSKSFATQMKSKLKKAKLSKSKLPTASSKQVTVQSQKGFFSDISNTNNVSHQHHKGIAKPTFSTQNGGKTKKLQHKPVEMCPRIESKSDITSKPQENRALKSKLPYGVTDIDFKQTDYFKEPIYAEDVMAYLREQENLFAIPRTFLDGKEVNHGMRAVLVDWLIQVQDHLSLEQETLHLAIMLVDHFLFRKVISMSKVQLVGVTCLLVAAKYIERFAPEIKDLVRLTDNTYTYEQVIRMELVVLKVMRFELHMPDPTVFLNRFFQIENSSHKVQLLSRYLIDLSLPDPTCVTFTSSMKAASALALARRLLGANVGVWSRNMAYYTGYCTESLLHPTMRRMVKLLQRLPTSKQQGAHSKYGRRLYESIAKADEVTSVIQLGQILSSLSDH